ncbi:DUF1045 domain-containing protein [Rhodobacterales bacterium HKCCE3408]|nr:DUF1045 domain-containing protein [Rhodobacterales bacterium HKCCE3408]
MPDHRRYAIYAVPEGALYRKGADWLGWDSVAGAEVSGPEPDGLPLPRARLTKTPRKYGFHGTLKPPFRLAEGESLAALSGAVAELAAGLPPVALPGLRVARMGGFVALLPEAQPEDLVRIADAAVGELDRFRAPSSAEELERRRRAGLSERQEDMLVRWGYPFVFGEFRFHMTLTGGFEPEIADALVPLLAGHFAAEIAAPVVIDSLALMGEGPDRRFRVLERHALTG